MITKEALTELIKEERLPLWRVMEYRTGNVLATNNDEDNVEESVRMLEERLETLKGYGRVTVKVTEDKSGKGDKNWSGNWSRANQYHVDLVNGNGHATEGMAGLSGGIGFRDYLDLNNRLMETRFELERKKLELETPRGSTTEIMDVLKTIKDIMSGDGAAPSTAQLKGIDYDILISDWNKKVEDEKYKKMVEQEGGEMNQTLAELMTKVDIRAIHKLMKALNENPEHAITALKKLS